MRIVLLVTLIKAQLATRLVTGVTDVRCPA